jgi:uncharacterized membrane protein
MSQEQSQVYHVVAYEFVGQDRAGQVVDLIRKSSKKSDFKVKAWAVVEMDEKSKAHVSQSGHGGVGTAAGLGVGALLGLVGGPAGLLVWALGGALIGGIAGKFLGHTFDADELKALTTSMVPNSSAILVIVENKAAEAMAKDMGEYDAQVVTLTMGSQISGEVATFAAVDLGEDAAPAAGETTAKA